MSSSGTQRAASPNDAQWLTEQLRSSRLTVLCGEAGDSMTELLTSGVLPQLQRRAVDRQPPPPPSRTAQVLPFPDRRAARSEAAEVCIYFDHWGESPRHALVERLLDAIGDRARRAAAGDGLPVRLGEKLSALSQRFGLRILLVLDRFDECLTAPAERPDLRALRDEILAAINLVQSPVQFLLVLREDGEPLLHQLRRRIEGFDAVRKPLPGTQASVRGPAEFSSIAAQAPQPTQPPDARPTGRTEAVYASIAGWLERSARTRAPQAAAPAGPAKPVDEAAPEPFDGGAPPAAQAIELPAFAGEPRGAAPGLEFAAPLREPVTLEPAGAAAREPAQAAQRPQRAAAAAPPLPGAATAPPAVQPLHAVAVSGPVPPATSSESPAGLERIAAEVADDVQTWAEHDDEPGEFHALSVVVPGEPDAPTIPRPAAEVPAEAEREAPSQVQAEAMQVSSTDAAQTAPTEAVQAAPAEVEPTARPEPEPAVPATLVEAEPTAPTEAVAGGSIDAVLAPPAPQPSGMEAVATAGDAGQALAWAGRAEEDDAPDAPAGRHPEEVGLPAAEPAEAEAADAEQVRAGPAAGTAPRQAEAVPGASDTAPSASDAAPNPAAAVPSAAETAPPRVHAAAPITFAAEPADLAPQASDSMPPRAMAELDAEAPLDAGASAAAEPANAGTAATPDREAEAEQADEPPQRMRYDEHPFEPDSSLFADTRPGPDHPDDEAPTAPLARDFAADDAAASPRVEGIDLGFDPRSAGGRASGGRRDRVPAARAASAASSARPRGGKGLRGAAGLLGVVAAVALVGALAAARWASPEREGELAMRPQPQGGFANIEPAVAPLAAAPRGRIALSAGDALASRIGDDLTRALARAGGPGVAVQDSRGWFEDLSSLRDGSRLAIARYDALQAARGDGGAGPLRIVMPLFTEELAFVVRADSPLRWIHQVEGKRINIGPPAGARALTVRTAYARLFNKPLASERSSLAGEAAALDELLGRSVDVVVLVGNAPAPWASAYPEMAGGLRLLALDRNHASTQRAMRSMLTAQLDAGADAGPDAPTTPTLAVMSFLVAGGGRAEAGAAGAAPSVDVGRVAAALCRQLPTLQRDGHPKWREVRPDLQLDAGWPYAAEAQGALRNCASQAAGPAAAPPPAASPAPRRPQQTAAGAAQAPEAS